MSSGTDPSDQSSSKASTCLHGNFRLGQEHRYAGPDRSTTARYGAEALPRHSPHTASAPAAAPVTGQARPDASDWAVRCDGTSGARASTRSRSQRSATLETLACGTDIRRGSVRVGSGPDDTAFTDPAEAVLAAEAGAPSGRCAPPPRPAGTPGACRCGPDRATEGIRGGFAKLRGLGERRQAGEGSTVRRVRRHRRPQGGRRADPRAGTGPGAGPGQGGRDQSWRVQDPRGLAALQVARHVPVRAGQRPSRDRRRDRAWSDRLRRRRRGHRLHRQPGQPGRIRRGRGAEPDRQARGCAVGGRRGAERRRRDRQRRGPGRRTGARATPWWSPARRAGSAR